MQNETNQKQKQKRIVVSACLAGVKCRYDGGTCLQDPFSEMIAQGKAIPICPEQLGGLSTPRLPSEIQQGTSELKVLANNGTDVTQNFQKGAEEALKIAQLVGATCAILKADSPSCGCGQIYDGTFKGKKIEGNGVTTDLFLKNGIKVYSELNYKDLEW